MGGLGRGGACQQIRGTASCAWVKNERFDPSSSVPPSLRPSPRPHARLTLTPTRHDESFDRRSMFTHMQQLGV